MTTFYTIGHSTRSLAELIEVLQAHGIKNLVDIRAFPASRRLPYFNRESLEVELPHAGITYFWEPHMGGRRKRITKESRNTAIRSDSFRNYADYMLTPEFQQAAADVKKLADERPTAYMCAEKLYFQCHRMMVSDYYVAHGGQVLHILDGNPPKPHTLMKEANLVNGELIYNAGQLF
ncbi:protein of unknown function DUF1130 [Candidatus Koribacter versatilis Ellin345]|uniref:Fe-S cluster assembly protein HesB n=1 Tax=Koribacter versatilis (strain Ellin345) TaxID=204669 RepID=Q1IHY0_KORVE|nr:DUF488 domain-containing protein [Candidatus Koribacter versatilis]ABF43520.1 protein of unknown function DUF1130 [Candidatus Koribacter versatilis Ellin345]